jgi:hypothetical protein
MNALILLAILFIIVIVIMVALQRPKARRRRKYEVVKSLDEPEARDNFMRDAAASTTSLDADELFTLATLYLRKQDDLQDRLHSELSDRESQKLTRQLQEVTHSARQAIRDAIAKRTDENDKQGTLTNNHGAQLFDDDTIERRAVEIEGAIATPIARRADPVAAIPAIPATVAVAPAKWASDPENVHDSAVGDNVSHRLQFLREHERHTIAEPIGEIVFVMKDRLPNEPENQQKRARIVRTLERARSDDHCVRYNVSELDALRLVLERANSAPTDEAKHNMQDALLNALAECAEGPSGTVCTVGRISRYIASLDGVDEQLPAIKSVDAYRTEIMNKIGQAKTKTPDDLALLGEVEKICDSYAGQIPDHSLARIKGECKAAILD